MNKLTEKTFISDFVECNVYRTPLRAFSELLYYCPQEPVDKPLRFFHDIFRNRKYYMFKDQHTYERYSIRFYYDDTASYVDYMIIELDSCITTHPVMIREVMLTSEVKQSEQHLPA